MYGEELLLGETIFSPEIFALITAMRDEKPKHEG